VGAKLSAEMQNARKLIESGVGVYAACERSGITPGAVYRSAWYKARSLEHSEIRQGDEVFCTKCRKRWGVEEVAPTCD
jgi:hypothetical protein